MKPDLSKVTLLCYENRDHAAALSLMSAMCERADFGQARLLNFFQGRPQFIYWENFEAWKYVTTDFALSVHLDGYIVHPECWEPSWLDYDFIGAPWPLGLNPDRVGNGGFCLKSRRLMNRMAALPWVDEPSDVLVCSRYRQLLIAEGFRFAPVDVAMRFSIEHPVEETRDRFAPTFGFHGDWNYPPWPSKLSPQKVTL